MNQTQYKVSFKKGGEILIWAWNPTEAKILAQAECIKAGRDYHVLSIEEIM